MMATVTKGTRFDNERGSAIAWLYMSQRGVSTQVILRVLTDPGLRRIDDPKALTLDWKKMRKIFRLTDALANIADSHALVASNLRNGE
jgi:hypothetical protein